MDETVDGRAEVSCLEAAFETAKRVADALVGMFGKRCEVAIHDLRDLDHSLVYLAGSLTSREIGAPITDLVLNVLNQSDHTQVRDLIGYRTLSKSGVEMKSSTVFLRNVKGVIIGALCINFQINDLRNILSSLHELIVFNTEEDSAHESFTTTVQEMVGEIVLSVTSKIGSSPVGMTVEEKIACVSALEEKGLFLIKGSVDYVANTLQVSRYTLYNYLQKVRSEQTYSQPQGRE